MDKENFIKEYNELVAKYKLQVIPQMTLVVTEVPEKEDGTRDKNQKTKK